MKYKQEQIDISNIPIDETANKNRKNRAIWRKGMQVYINKQQMSDRANIDGWCVCGNMRMCDYCADSAIAKACVNNIEKMCEEKRISIDYSRTDYEKQLEEIEQ